MAGLFPRTGGVFRTPTHIFCRTGGIWREVQKAYVRSGGIWRQVYALFSGTLVQPFTAWIAWGNNPTPGQLAQATLNFLSNGTVTGPGTTGDDGTPGSANWITPTTVGIGAGYWVRLTVTAGALTTGIVGAWTNLGTTQTWTKSATSGSAAATVTIEIATDSSGANIVFTSTGNILKFTHAPS